MQDLLKKTYECGGSDLHLVAGIEPCIRINGDLKRQEDLPKLKPEDISTMLKEITSPMQRDKLEADWELDLAVSVPNCARFRGNVIVQRGTLAAVFRAIPFEVPDLDKLGLPADVKRLCNLPRGLVLVTGPTGSGKSTTLAAMIKYINQRYETNIVTVEDPIEFVHTHIKSTVRQREVGTDTHSFANALRTALRHDPDTIMIGEMRDPESISIAVTAAETGHLVFSTLHTNGAVETISRVVDIFPGENQSHIRVQLSSVLEGVLSQMLIPMANGKGMALACEILVATPAVRNIIREGKMHTLEGLMEIGTEAGMQTMEYSFKELYLRGKITYEEAEARVTDIEGFKKLIGAVPSDDLGMGTGV